MGDVDPGVDISSPGRRYLDGELLLDQLITDRVGLDDVNEAFAALLAVEARTIVTFPPSGPPGPARPSMKANTYHQAPERLTAAPPGCPIESQWSSAWTRTTSTTRIRSPARLREDHRCSSPSRSDISCSRMDDIEAVFTNPDVFASTNVQDPLFPLAPEAAAILAAEDFDPIAVMSNRPEPDHGRIRVYTARASATAGCSPSRSTCARGRSS